MKPNHQRTIHEIDYRLTQEQARLERRWADLDLDNLVDEVTSVGSSEKRQIRNRLAKLLSHLLKWKYQPGLRGSSWTSTIFDRRRQLIGVLEDSPSLRNYFHEQIGVRYLSGRLEAAKETGIAFGLFPEECPLQSRYSTSSSSEDRSIE